MKCAKMVQRLFRAAPVAWRNEQNYTLRRTVFGMSTVAIAFAWIAMLRRSEEDEMFKTLVVCCEGAACIACACTFVLLRKLRNRPALLETFTFFAISLIMVCQYIANLMRPVEFRVSTAARSFSQFCYGVVILGLHPAYNVALLIFVTITHFIVATQFAFYDQGPEDIPDGLMQELTADIVVPVIGLAIAIMFNQMNFQLFKYQEQREQESHALNKLLGMSCDFVLPLHKEDQSSEICISQVKPELKAFVGSVEEGASLRTIMCQESFEHFSHQVAQLAPMQPLLFPVTLCHGSSPLAAEMLMIRCKHLDESDKFLVGVRVQEELAPPDVSQALPPDGLENIRAPSALLSIMPEAYEDSELGKSEAAFTTKTGMIFNCSKPKEAWRNILQLGRKEHWLVPADNLTVDPCRILGSGGFGLVCEGQYCGANVAVKVPRKSFNTGDGVEAASAVEMLIDYLQELRLLRIARHPNIVIFYGAFMAPPRGEVALVFERIEGPTLDLFILAGDVADTYKIRMMLDITNALLYLHSLRPQIVHGDVKPGNVFVECREGQMQTKLADFGLARRITLSAATMGGTLRWAAPELLSGNRGPSTSADIYSLGQLMYFIITTQRPYSGLSQAECQAAIQHGFDPTEAWPSGAFYFLLKPVVDYCRRANPLERPPATEVADVLNNFSASRPGAGQRLKSSEIFVGKGKKNGIFGPSKLPGTTPSEDESEDLGELDAATELCQAFDRARMLAMSRLTT